MKPIRAMLRFMKQRSRSEIPWPVFAVTVAAAFMVALDLSIVNVAFPSIRRSFPDVSTATLSWVLAAYSVVFGALLLGAGRIADRSGRRRIFLLGLLIFTVGSLLCGVAPSAWLLIAGRVVQAIGAALLMPASLALLLTATPPASARPQAVAMWGGISALAVATGPSLGSVLIDAGGWRWAFFVNLPVALVAGVATRRVVPESIIGGRVPDLLGVAMLSAAVASLALAITQGGEWGWSSWRVVALFVAGGRARPDRRPPLGPPRGTGDRPRRVPVAHGGAGECGDVAVLGRLLRDAAGERPVPHVGVELLDPRSRPRHHAGAAPRRGVERSERPPRGTARLRPRARCRRSDLRRRVALLRHHGRRRRATTSPTGCPGRCSSASGWRCRSRCSSAAAVAGLPQERFGIGGAINQTARQIGAVLGVAILIAVIGTPASLDQALARFRVAWLIGAVAAVGSAAISSFHRRPARAQAPARRGGAGAGGRGMTFADDTAVERVGPRCFAAELHERWSSLVGIHGGYTAAIVVRAMQAAVDDASRALRSFATQFAAVPRPGPVQVEVTVERVGDR